MGIPGLKRGMVSLSPHQAQWKADARVVVAQLRAVFGKAAVDVQHIGSTSIAGICAKPIIDLVVGVEDLNVVKAYIPRLEQQGIVFHGQDVRGNCCLFWETLGRISAPTISMWSSGTARSGGII